MTWLLVFLSVFALDFVWTFYTASMVARRAAWAGLWSALIFGIGGFAVTRYIEDKVLLIPAMAGAFVGTYLSVLLEKRRKC